MTVINTNIGALGVGRFATPMIVPPCVGTLALGAVYQSPVLIEVQWQAHPHLPISLTFDHRVVYGAEAARFLRAFSQNLQQAQLRQKTFADEEPKRFYLHQRAFNSTAKSSKADNPEKFGGI